MCAISSLTSTFAISSPDEFLLLNVIANVFLIFHVLFTLLAV